MVLKDEMIIEFLNKMTDSFLKECDSLPLINNNSGFFISNGSFESIDSEILYSLIRDLTPKNIIEVGSGFSTLLIKKGLVKNNIETNSKCNFTSIDPVIHYNFLEQMEDVNFIDKQVQDVDIGIFSKFNIL